MPLSKEDIKHFEKSLIDRKNELEELREINDQFRADEENDQESTGELSNYDNHPGDLGTELFDRERNMVLNELQENELEDIDQALQRIDDGSYGVCKKCGKDIAKERLEALPFTTLCIEDAAIEKDGQETDRERPLEEDVLSPGYGQFNNDDKDRNFFDGEDAWESVSRYGTSETPADNPEKGDYSDSDNDPDDTEGYTEDLEGFIVTDITGNNRQVVQNKKHEEYEDRLDEEEERLNDKRKYDS